MPNPSAPRPTQCRNCTHWRCDFPRRDRVAEDWDSGKCHRHSPVVSPRSCSHTDDRTVWPETKAKDGCGDFSLADRRTYCTECGERVTMDATLRDLYGDLCDAHAHDRAHEARMTQGE